MNELSLAARAKAERETRKLLAGLPPTFTLKVRGEKKEYATHELVSRADTHRPAKELCQMLKGRLMLLTTMRREWGKLDDVYGHYESDFDSTPLPWSIRDPTSSFSTWWDLVQVWFLLYVTWTVPLRACFGIEVEIPSMAWAFDTVVDIYFIFDLFLNFVTAYYDSTGTREARVSMIAKRYLSGWFAVDVRTPIICTPLRKAFAVHHSLDECRSTVPFMHSGQLHHYGARGG